MSKEESSVILWPQGMKFCDSFENRALTGKCSFYILVVSLILSSLLVSVVRK